MESVPAAEHGVGDGPARDAHHVEFLDVEHAGLLHLATLGGDREVGAAADGLSLEEALNGAGVGHVTSQVSCCQRCC